MNGAQEQLFLQVKQKLDYYRLPTIFPVDATNLLHKLLKILDKYRVQSRQNNPSSSNVSGQKSTVQGAIRSQMGKVVKENNQLHLDLMETKEEIQSLKHCLDKIAIQKSSNQKETENVLALKNTRERQLFDELNRAKYRYNQLLDMVHEDPKIEKMYIKRLYKHKKYDIDGEQMMKQTRPPQHKNRQTDGAYQLQRRVQILADKIRNRETEILRLQNKLQYDGLNMNKVLKDFNDDSTRSKVSALNQQLQYLEGENKKMKQEVAKSRNTGGLKEALRQEVRKNHEEIKKLDQDNKTLRRKLKEHNFDGQAKTKSTKRDVKKAQDKLKNEQQVKNSLQFQVDDLDKKVDFYAQEADHFKAKAFALEKELVNKQVLIEELKNRNAEGKILQKYELESLRKKIEESDEILRELMSTNKMIADQNKFYREEGNLKSEAIQNLQNIASQLKRRLAQNQESLLAVQDLKQNQRDEVDMMRQIVDLKQQLVFVQNNKISSDTEYDRALSQLDRANKERSILSDQLNRLKCRIADQRSLEQSTILLKRELQEGRLLLRKEQSARNRAESILKEIEQQKEAFRKELADLSIEARANEKVLRNQINQKQIKIAEFEQANNILQMRIQEKDTKIRFYEQKIGECQGKLKGMSDQILILEDEKQLIVKDKHRVDRRYEQLVKDREQVRERELQLISINENEHANEIAWLKKQIHGLNQKNAKYVEAYNEMTDMVTILRREKDELNLDKINFMRENDHLRLRLQETERELALRLAR